MMKLPGGSSRLETGWAAQPLGVGSSVIRQGCAIRSADGTGFETRRASRLLARAAKKYKSLTENQTDGQTVTK